MSFSKFENTATATFDLVADGPVLVASGVSNKTDPTLPDNTFLVGKYTSGNQTTYVIPGSSIKGAIRSYCHSYLENINSGYPLKQIDGLFGKCGNKSKISFHDAYADINTIKTNIRYNTAIDSLSQLPKDKSLNNAEAVESGIFKAGFRLVNFDKKEMFIILNALESINYGVVKFGGRKSRGYGMMRVQNFNLKIRDEISSDLVYNTRTITSLEEAVSAYKDGGNND